MISKLLEIGVGHAKGVRLWDGVDLDVAHAECDAGHVGKFVLEGEGIAVILDNVERHVRRVTLLAVFRNVGGVLPVAGGASVSKRVPGGRRGGSATSTHRERRIHLDHSTGEHGLVAVARWQLRGRGRNIVEGGPSGAEKEFPKASSSVSHWFILFDALYYVGKRGVGFGVGHKAVVKGVKEFDLRFQEVYERENDRVVFYSGRDI